MKICPVCNRKVGEWHTGGVHPACMPKLKELWKERGIGARLTQAQRDDILRGINRPR
jgi:Zn-finger nucleic acid-binding protein